MATKTQPERPADAEAQRLPVRRAWRQWAALGVILLVAVAVRAAYLREIVRTPDFAQPAVDAGFHDYWAWGLAGGDWTPPRDLSDPKIPRTPFFRPPGYPYFLAGVYALFGHSYLAARVANMLLGVVNCALVFLIGRRFYRPAVGLLAAAGMAAYWVFVYFEGELHAPALLIALLLGALYFLGAWAEKRRLWQPAAAGALLGLGILVRPNVGLLVPVVVVWAGWIGRRRGGWKRALTTAAALALPAAAAVLPVTIRNYLVGDDLVVVSANAGINLYIGNNETADGKCAGEIAGLGEFGTCFDYPGIVRNLEAKLGRRLKPSEVSAWFSDQARRFIRQNPGRAFGLLARKFCLFWGPVEVGHNKEVHYERALSSTLKHLPGGFPLVAALAAVGFGMMIADARRRKEASGRADPKPAAALSLLMGLWVGVLSGSILPFFVAGRYRVPILPLLMLAGAYALAALAGRVRARRWGSVTGWVGAGGLVLIAVAWMPYRDQPSLAKWHYDRGDCYAFAGQFDQAEGHFRQALQADPGHALACYNLGVMLSKQGRLDEAVKKWRQALRMKPDMAQAHNNLGTARLRAGRVDEAIKHWRQAVRLRPDYATAQANLGAALVQVGRGDEGVAHLRRALALNPGDGQTHFHLGLALLGLGKIDGAGRHFAAALQAVPDSAEAMFQLGQVRHLQDRIPEALEQYRRALALPGDHVGVRNNMAWLFATHPRAEHRNGAEAVRLARQVCEKTGYRNAGYLDTLAAACAEAGQFDQAVETTRKGIALARQAGQHKQLQRMEQRLKLYVAGRPYREQR